MYIHHTLGRRRVKVQDFLSRVAVEGLRVDVQDAGGNTALFVEFLGLVDGLAEVTGEDGGGLLVGMTDDWRESGVRYGREERLCLAYQSRRPCCRAG